MNTNSRKQELLGKYLDNECSHAELEELFEYLKSGDDSSYEEVMDDLWKKIQNEKILDETKAACIVSTAVNVGEIYKVKPYKTFQWYKIAAAVAVLLMGFGSYYLVIHRNKQLPKVALNGPGLNNFDIKPGTKKAILQAGNVQIALDKKDTSFTLAGNTINSNNGEIHIADQKPVQYTLIVPRGGEYNLILADGTKVWLNADSKLIYPSIFTSQTRDVYLTGEAYFKVKTDANHPFIVHAGKQNIKVLGTEFNIQAYPDENENTTTLVDGKVQVNSFNKEMILKPGQQAVSGENGQVDLHPNADIEQAIAWKNGYFRFDNTNIYEIMEQLSRWYNVKVLYEKGVQAHDFLAIINRNNNISQVLSMLEETGEIHFKIEGDEVMVMQ